MKLLFVCMANLNRSPTFEKYFKKNMPAFEVKSAGIYYSYPERFDDLLLTWADKIFVMDLLQEMFISENFPQFLNKVEVIGVSDQYDPDDPELIKLIEYWIKKMGS